MVSGGSVVVQHLIVKHRTGGMSKSNLSSTTKCDQNHTTEKYIFWSQQKLELSMSFFCSTNRPQTFFLTYLPSFTEFYHGKFTAKIYFTGGKITKAL
jgi:hypothetical protein